MRARILWFAGLYAGGVAATGLAAAIIRAFLKG
jgi:hypothetical protein